MKQVSHTLVVLPPREVLVQRAVSRMLFKAPHLTSQPNDISIKKDIEDAMRKVLVATLDVPTDEPNEGTPLPALLAHLGDTLALIKELEDRLPRLSGLIEQAKAREYPADAPATEPAAASDEIATPPADPSCEDALLPDGPVCPRCGKERGPSGADGGSWVHIDRSLVKP